MKTYALDFESFYDSDCSITTLGPRGYFSHPNFDAYMVTVVGDDSYSYAGHPKDFDWSVIEGHNVVMHNASFDESLYLYGVEQGWYPKVNFNCYCTADMVAFLGLPRSLKNATAAVFGTEITKTTRDNMKGKQWGSMTEDFKKEVTEYAIKDAELCLKLWQELSDKWPESERQISRLNRQVGQRGLPIDTDLLQKNLSQIKTELFNAEQSIPWIADYTPLSRKAFNEQCRKQGITPPSSLAQDSEEADAWFAAHQQACPWARAVQSYRRINAFLRKLEAFDAGTMSDGRYYGGLMYCGANPTARFSGSGGNLNLQNLPRDVMFGVNFRHMIKPKKGHKLIVADLSQIEVRTLCWLAKDTKALNLIRESEDIYHAFGVLLGLHDPANGPLREYDKALRHKVKSIVLGCGYGMGPNKFSMFANMPLKEAEDAVRTYRDRMSSVVKYWRSLDQDMIMAYSLEEPFELDLPSGRSMSYGKLKRMKESGGMNRFRYIGKLVRMGQLRDFALWGGILTENCVSHDTEVLTRDRGWMPISEIQRNQYVWDGLEFVTHDGFLAKGEQPVIDVFGVSATPDHCFLVGGSWVEAQKACTLPIEEVASPSYEAQGLHGTDIWDLHCNTTGGVNRKLQRDGARDKGPMGTSVPLRSEGYQGLQRNQKSQNLRLRVPNTLRAHSENPNDTRAIEAQAICYMAFNERPMPTGNTSSLVKLRGSRDICMSEMAEELPELLGRHECFVDSRPHTGQDRQQQGIRTGELPLGYTVAAGAEYPQIQDHTRSPRLSKKEWGERQHSSLSPHKRLAPSTSSDCRTKTIKSVGDLLNCGPRHRFAVRAGEGYPVLIAHNCSQGLARDIFSDMMLRVDAAGYPVILHVHDEMVCEVPEEQAEQALTDILKIMHTAPSWIPDIPVAAEGHILDLYSK